MNIVMPMAGMGTRMNSITPKHLIPVNGTPMFLQALYSFHPNIWDEVVMGNINLTFVVRAEHIRDTREHIDHPNINWAVLKNITSGPAATVWEARKYIVPDEPMVTLNCDQMFRWDGRKRLGEAAKYSAAVFTFPSTDPKCSYVKQEQGCAVQFAEKQVISSHALTGVHYWSAGQHFLTSCEQMMKDDVRVNGEHYISMTYNYLVPSMCVGVVETSPDETILIGTEQELRDYESSTTI